MIRCWYGQYEVDTFGDILAGGHYVDVPLLIRPITGMAAYTYPSNILVRRTVLTAIVRFVINILSCLPSMRSDQRKGGYRYLSAGFAEIRVRDIVTETPLFSALGF